MFVSDGVYIDMPWWFNGGSDEVGFMAFGVGGEGTEQLLRLI